MRSDSLIYAMTTAAARPMRPAKPTWTLLRAALFEAVGDVAALVGVATRVVEPALVGAWLIVRGVVAELAAEETETIELVDTATAEEEETTAEVDAMEADIEDDTAAELPETVGATEAETEAELDAPMQLASALLWIVTGAENATMPVESRSSKVICVPAAMFATQVREFPLWAPKS